MDPSAGPSPYRPRHLGTRPGPTGPQSGAGPAQQHAASISVAESPAVLRTQYAQGRGDPAVDVRAEQERVRLERKRTALDREVSRLVDAYQAEVIELTELA